MKHDAFIRNRLTELRMKKGVSEHRMSLDLDKSGSYIRGITNEGAMPSVKELFSIIAYFDMTPVEFFLPLQEHDSRYYKLYERLCSLNEADLEKVETFISWLEE